MTDLLLPSPALLPEDRSRRPSPRITVSRPEDTSRKHSTDEQFPEHYTEEQKRLVRSPLYQHLLKQAIADMEAYAKEHNLVDFEDPIPESAYVRSRFRNIWGFVKYCFDNSVNQNPYKVPKSVYVICVVMLATAIIIKVWVVKQVSEHVEPCHHVFKVDQTVVDTLTGTASIMVRKVNCHPTADIPRTWDTLASSLPIVVTLLLFLFPPLLSNWEPSKDRLEEKKRALRAVELEQGF